MTVPRRLDAGRGTLPDPATVEMVVKHLKAGGLVALPTETVYGFSCIPEPGPLAKIMQLKNRDRDKPFLLLIPSVESVAELDWPREARELAQVFWPGALTLILADPGSRFPPGVRSPSGGVAVRVSPHPLAAALVEGVGRPLVSTSANLEGGEPALTGEEAFETAKTLGAGADLWVLDGGPLPPSDPSTVIDCTGASPRVLRSGAIPVNRVRCVLPEIHGTSDE